GPFRQRAKGHHKKLLDNITNTGSLRGFSEFSIAGNGTLRLLCGEPECQHDCSSLKTAHLFSGGLDSRFWNFADSKCGLRRRANWPIPPIWLAPPALSRDTKHPWAATGCASWNTCRKRSGAAQIL